MVFVVEQAIIPIEKEIQKQKYKVAYEFVLDTGICKNKGLSFIDKKYTININDVT